MLPHTTWAQLFSGTIVEDSITFFTLCILCLQSQHHIDSTAKFCQLSVLSLYGHPWKQLSLSKRTSSEIFSVCFLSNELVFSQDGVFNVWSPVLRPHLCFLNEEYHFLFNGSNLFNIYKFFVTCPLLV